MWMYDVKVNVKWIGIIKHLFNVAMSREEKHITRYDNYIYSTFECFVRQKTKLEIKMGRLWQVNHGFIKLIIGKLEIAGPERDNATIRSMVNDEDNINLPRKEIFNVFDNAQELGLNLHHQYGLFPISLSNLLSNIKYNDSLHTITIRLVSPAKHTHLRELYGISWELERRYRNAGHSIHLEYSISEHNYGGGIYCIIKKKKMI